MAGVGVSGSSSFGMSSGSTNQSANNQKFAGMFGKKNLRGSDLVKPAALICSLILGALVIKKKIGA